MQLNIFKAVHKQELINNVPKLTPLAISTVFFILANGRKSIFGGHLETEVQGQF